MNEATEATVTSWLAEKGLKRFQEDLGSLFAIETLDDILDLTEDDLDIICADLNMKLGERNRFRREVKQYQSRQSLGIAKIDEKENTNIQEISCEATKAKLEEKIAPESTQMVPHHDDAEVLQEQSQGVVGQAPRAELLQEQSQEVVEVQPQGVVRHVRRGDFEWFEVLQNMVFIRSAPKKDAEGIGIVRKGEKIQVNIKRVLDKDLHEWVVLTPIQFEHSCKSDEADGGFALIDGTHLGLGKLLKGPVEPDFPPEVVTVAQHSDVSQGRLESAENWQEIRLAMQREQEQREQDQEWMKAEKRLDNFEREQTRLQNKLHIEEAEIQRAMNSQLDIYRVARKINYIRESEDPSLATDVQVSCKVGRCIFSTGKEWLEDYTNLWVEQLNNGPSAKPRWFLAKTNSDDGKPYLMKEVERIKVEISWCNYRGQELKFSMYMHKEAVVRMLKIRFCEETCLKAKWTIFLMKKPNHPGADQVGGRGGTTMLDDDRTLASYGFVDNANLLLSYVGDFDEDYMDGKLLKMED